MKHLGLSFGGTKIVGMFGVVEELLNEGYKPDIISGISTGAVLALPIALGKVKEVKQILDNLNTDTFMNENPFTKNGKIKISALVSLLFKNYLGRQDKIVDLLQSIITKKEFNNWQNDKNRVEVYVQSVNLYNGSRKISKLSSLTYDECFNQILASASIPVYVDGVSGFNSKYYDGGLRNFILTPYILKNIEGITESISIYTRPEDYKIKDSSTNSLIKTLTRIIDIFLVEISKKDEFEERTILKEKNIKGIIYYLPKVLETVYDVDDYRLKKLYIEGKNLVKNNLGVRVN